MTMQSFVPLQVGFPHTPPPALLHQLTLSLVFLLSVDLDTDREIKIDAEQIAKKFNGAPFVEISAVSGYNVNALMKLALEAANDARKGRDHKLKEEKRRQEEAKKLQKEEEKKAKDEEKRKKKEQEALKKVAEKAASGTAASPSFALAPLLKMEKKLRKETSPPVSLMPAASAGGPSIKEVTPRKK
jgi:Fe2+ transport system protein B